LSEDGGDVRHGASMDDLAMRAHRSHQTLRRALSPMIQDEHAGRANVDAYEIRRARAMA